MILVQALEEFPHNNEFVGRNFNAGEVIQLVLRNKQGHWLPERWVMMVMVHELAHCKQMNHSKAFWKVRDDYAKDLRELWGRGYTGEGLWGRGRDLDSGELHMGSVAVGDVPEHLCGGTYSRKRRKRRRGGKGKEELTYKEKKERRILKKFGANGQALGADDGTKVKLEGGVAKKGKPRVAGSARGRDLRAAAALARFDTVKKEEVPIKKEETDSDSETEDEYEEASAEDAAIDVDGKKMLDDNGRALVKICEDDDNGDDNARREMEEIQDIDLEPKDPRPSVKREPPIVTKEASNVPKPASGRPIPKQRPSAHILNLNETYKRRPESLDPQPPSKASPSVPIPPKACPICSLDDELGATTCAACSNVLRPHLDPVHWRCGGDACKGSGYINASDVGRCGLCGAAKPPIQQPRRR